MENDLGVHGHNEVNPNDLIIIELLQGEAVNRLRMCRNNAPLSSSSQESSQEVLVNKIMSSFDNAFCMLNHHAGRSNPNSDHELIRDASGRRRCRRALWTDQVHVNPGAGLEEAHGDGYSWRKYGQKNILGAQFPRGYYRCTYRDSQDGSAKKQIQQSDEDPTIFNVCYKGSHTCSNQNPPPLATLENQEPTSMLQIQQEENNNNNNNNNNIKVVTTDNNGGHDDDNPFHYSFSDIASSSGVFKVGEIDCGFMQPPQMLFGNTSFVSSTTNVNNVGGTQYMVTSEVEVEIPTLGARSSGTDSPVVGMEFLPFNDAAMDFDFDEFGF